MLYNYNKTRYKLIHSGIALMLYNKTKINPNPLYIYLFLDIQMTRQHYNLCSPQ